MKSSLYLTGKWILTAYINLWRSNEVTSDVFKASLSDLAAFCRGERRLIYENLMSLMEAGFLSHIKSNDVEGAVVQVGLSFEIISAIVERSFEYPFEEAEQTTNAILERFPFAGNSEVTFLQRYDDDLL